MTARERMKNFAHSIGFLNFLNLNVYAVLRDPGLRQRCREEIAACVQKTGQNVFLFCMRMYFVCLLTSATVHDYYRFSFWKMSVREVNRYLTTGRLNRIMPYLKSREASKIMNDKGKFNAAFKDFVRRDWISISMETTPDDLALMSFLGKHPVFVAKKSNMKRGIGIELIDCRKFKTPQMLLSYLKLKSLFQLEEKLENHEVLAKFSLRSLNTFRMVTVRLPEGPKIIGSYLTFSATDSLADNALGCWCAAPVDTESGNLVKGYTDERELEGTYSPTHFLGFPVVGIQMPFWDEVKDLALRATTLRSDVYYGVWDVAVTPGGPCILEGNNINGIGFQLTTGVPVYADMQRMYRYARRIGRQH